jgi:hypothetical protein
MNAIRAERGGLADPEAWKSALSNFKSRVFSSADRARLWRKERRKHPGDLIELDRVTRATAHDLAALKALLDQLSR